MTKLQFKKIEHHMMSLMHDSAHDKEHIYRVLYCALDIAQTERNVDMDILIAACLLHDIGRYKQFEDPTTCHAQAGSIMAYDYLIEIGWDASASLHVKNCIASHRFRGDNHPDSVEAKILFDADKVDITGTIGIARTLFYQGIMSQPLYTTDDMGKVNTGTSDEIPSFFREYNYKLKKIYNNFYTERAKEIAKERQQSSIDFYAHIYSDTSRTHEIGMNLLEQLF